MFKGNRLSIFAIFLLSVFMMSVVWVNYDSQVELRDASIKRFREDSARKAEVLSHFFSERINDLNDVSASREILGFFSDRLTGMAGKEDNRTMLEDISELFKRFCLLKKIHGIQIYRMMAFVDGDARILADNTGPHPVSRDSVSMDIVEKATAGQTSIRVTGKNEKQIVFVHPLSFNGQRKGAVIAWLNSSEKGDSLLEEAVTGSYGGLELFVYNKDKIYSPQGNVPDGFSSIVIKGLLPSDGKVLTKVLQDGQRRKAFLITCSSVRGTPFQLVYFVPRNDVLGRYEPWQILLTTIVVAVLLLGCGVVLLISNVRNLRLKVQIEESAKQAEFVSERRERLEAEIRARKTAEESLRKINDELEERVEERTNALRERTNDLIREVTERREAEDAMRIIFNRAYDAFIIHDVQGNIIEVNERVLELYKVSLDQIFGLSVRDDLSSPDNQLEVLDEYWGRALGGEDVIFDWTARRPSDGSVFDAEVALCRIEQGGKTAILSTVRDVSELRKIQVQQQEHQEFLNTIFMGIGAAIFVFEPSEGVMVDCNSVGEELLSLTTEQILDPNSQHSFVFKSDSEKDLLCPDVHEQGSYEEGMLIMPDGMSIPVSRRLFEVHIGGRSHLVQVVFDISERKVLERKLNIAQKLESIGQLASGIAHEINTPIQYVGDSIRFVKEAFEDIESLQEQYDRLVADSGDWPGKAARLQEIEEFKDDLDMEFVMEEIPKACKRALEGVERVATIVLAMKNFSHPGEEKPKAVDINKAVMNTVTVSRNEWKYVAELETSLSPDLPLVHGFPGGINQVLLNVIVNAAHAIMEKVQGDEKGTITVSTSYIYPDVEIRITDTGCGIPRDIIMKIYDPFFTTKEVGKGTGQGLAIVHDIVVEKHGGTVDIESEVGKGTTFIIRLPVEAAEEIPVITE
ncbi:PAS domain S-box protein [Maridesulfovibrio sp.]|uniref:PAS domain-containing sensor histidine kinase n=1 Tax=Maridesulfovibrio sp. TaxID=2795000 RepID=UPI002A188433|nr:PAS domain S-box protein [Maridesulfovibrio sp.]